MKLVERTLFRLYMGANCPTTLEQNYMLVLERNATER